MATPVEAVVVDVLTSRYHCDHEVFEHWLDERYLAAYAKRTAQSLLGRVEEGGRGALEAVLRALRTNPAHPLYARLRDLTQMSFTDAELWPVLGRHLDDIVSAIDEVTQTP